MRAASICAGTIAALLAWHAAGQAQHSADFFPMEKGVTWVYEGRVKWTTPDTQPPKVNEENVRWNVTVTDAVRVRGVSAILLSGGPWDLAWYEPGVQPGKHLIIRIGGTYYLLHDDDAVSTFADIKAEKVDGFEERLTDDVWFKAGMRADDSFCAPDIEAQAPMYCWNVASVVTGKSLKVAGVPPSLRTTEYQLVFRTGPDHEVLTLVPGVGITEWEYAHHGTVAETSLKLVEFRAAQSRGRVSQ